MAERPCNCDGGNENCVFCSGTGYVKDGIPWAGGGKGGMKFVPANKAKSEKLASEMSHYRRVNTRDGVLCARCKTRVLNLRRHLETCLRSNLHRKRQEPTSRAKATGRLRELQPVAKNRSASPGGSQSTARTKAPTAFQNQSTAMVACPNCGVNLRPHRLKSHLVEKCPKKARRTRPGHSSTTTIRRELPVTVGTVNEKKGRIYDLVRGRDRKDATKDYAFGFRERGRYGSHPSHDGIDDESSAE
jgi:ribosomal protein L32